MDNYTLERKYREMKQSYDGIVNANIKLQDERELTIRDNKVLQKRINLAIDYLKTTDRISKKELFNILQNG